jgi:3-dehydroquinate dehydratase / shikimate dehydrogenase
MLCVTLKGCESPQEISTLAKYADLIELRLDHFSSLNPIEIQNIRTLAGLPVIFTLRKSSDGGVYPHSQEKQFEEIHHLCTLGPDYFDLEDSIPDEMIFKLQKQFPEIRWIYSHHDHSPHEIDIAALFSRMKRIDATFYKIAKETSSTTESLKLLSFKQSAPKNLIVIAMEEREEATRLLGPILENPITYTCLHQPLAPGMIPCHTFHERYHYPSLNRDTRIFCLIGNPVVQSPSHITHNAIFHERGLNAIYCKFLLKEEELPLFFTQMRQLNFSGLSVTIPFKEKVAPFLDRIDPEAEAIGAINTIVREGNHYVGYNTDGRGAFDAISKTLDVKGKKILLFGAGGAARAIAYEGRKRGAEILIAARNPEKAAALNCPTLPLEAIPATPYDLLINCSPVQIQSDYLLPGACIMDLSPSFERSPLLDKALEKGCIAISGHEMFIHQAIYQFELWFN